MSGESIKRWSAVAGLSLVTAAWAWLFYGNYWNASVVAFGDIQSHLADLRMVFWKYLGVGAALAAGWVGALRSFMRPEVKANQVERAPMRGN